VSRERARRRAERLAVAERERAARARKVARRQRRRDLIRKLTPRRRRVGRLARRSRAERAGIAAVALVAAGAIWFLVGSPALRIVLGILLVLALPVAVVLAFGRRT
jgi:Flp pilus assembly protein TadB